MGANPFEIPRVQGGRHGVTLGEAGLTGRRQIARDVVALPLDSQVVPDEGQRPLGVSRSQDADNAVEERRDGRFDATDIRVETPAVQLPGMRVGKLPDVLGVVAESARCR